MISKELIWYAIPLGMVIMLGMTVAVRVVLLQATINKRMTFGKIVRTVALVLFAFVSPDYVAAYLSKAKIDSYCEGQRKNYADDKQYNEFKKEIKAKYITSANTVNLVISVMLMIVAACVAMFCDGWAYNIFYGLVAYRLLSRTLEINISFVRDIADGSKNKNSTLTAGQRVSLAIRSLVEEAALFAAIYCFILHITSDCWLDAFTGGLFSFVYDVFSKDSSILRFTSVYQKVCSVTLIVLCIAVYLDCHKNETDDKTDNTKVPKNQKNVEKQKRPEPIRPKKNKTTETNPTE